MSDNYSVIHWIYLSVAQLQTNCAANNLGGPSALYEMHYFVGISKIICGWLKLVHKVCHLVVTAKNQKIGKKWMSMQLWRYAYLVLVVFIFFVTFYINFPGHLHLVIASMVMYHCSHKLNREDAVDHNRWRKR